MWMQHATHVCIGYKKSIMFGSAVIFTPQLTQKLQRCNFHTTAHTSYYTLLHTHTHTGTSYLREDRVLVRVVVVPEELRGPQVLLDHLDLGLVTPC